MDYIFIIIAIILFLNTLLIGFLFGKNAQSNGILTNSSIVNKKNNAKIASVSIDDKKFVVDIKTAGLEKKYDTLGETKTTDENISESVNKLKNLKG